MILLQKRKTENTLLSKQPAASARLLTWCPRVISSHTAPHQAGHLLLLALSHQFRESPAFVVTVAQGSYVQVQSSVLHCSLRNIWLQVTET